MPKENVYHVRFSLHWTRSDSCTALDDFMCIVHEYLPIKKTKIGFTEPFKRYSEKREKELIHKLRTGRDSGLCYTYKAQRLIDEILISLRLPQIDQRRGYGTLEGEVVVPIHKVDRFSCAILELIEKHSPFYAWMHPVAVYGENEKKLLPLRGGPPQVGFGVLYWYNVFSYEYADFLDIRSFNHPKFSCETHGTYVIGKILTDWENSKAATWDIMNAFKEFAPEDIFATVMKPRIPDFLQKDLE